MIFAREISDPLTSLVKKIDQATAKHEDARMGSFVVFLSDDEGLEQRLKELARKEGIKNTVLTVMDNRSGPPGYNVSPQADVTVILYTRKTVKANHAFKKGELTQKDVDRLVSEIPKIVP